MIICVLPLNELFCCLSVCNLFIAINFLIMIYCNVNRYLLYFCSVLYICEWLLLQMHSFLFQVNNSLIKPPLFEKVTYNKTIDNLYAYMQYDFRVRLHTGTGKIREHMWSDAAVTTQKTDPKCKYITYVKHQIYLYCKSWDKLITSSK